MTTDKIDPVRRYVYTLPDRISFQVKHFSLSSDTPYPFPPSLPGWRFRRSGLSGRVPSVFPLLLPFPKATFNHFYEKLFLLKDLMNTDTAKKIAEQRESYMKTYLSEFLDEWEGIR